MNDVTRGRWTRTRPPGHDPARGSVRFTAEVAAMVVTPWALWSHSPALAIGAVSLFVALPAVFSTPGDRPGGDGPVAVPGIVTILILMLTLSAAVLGAWAVWPWWVASLVTALAFATIATEQPRWRALTRPCNPEPHLHLQHPGPQLSCDHAGQKRA